MQWLKTDLFIFLVAFVLITLVTFFTQYFSNKSNSAALIGRKILHICTMLICAGVVNCVNNQLLLAYIFLAFTFILLYLVNRKLFLFSYSNSLGIPAFAFAFFVMLVMPIFSKPIIIAAMVILGISDAAAGLIGKAYGKKSTFLYEEKSFLGFAVFLVTAWIILMLTFNFNNWLSLFLIALVLALIELFSWRGLDNFTVPIMACILMYFISNNNAIVYINDSLLFVLFGLPLGYFILFKKWLVIPALFAALLIGLITVFCLGLKSVLLPFLFLLFGSLLSKLNVKSIEEKNGRTAVQVFANGMVATLCAIAFAYSQNKVFLLCFISSYAISICDTTSSDIGRFFKGKTIDVLTLKKTKIGLSGGISLQGSFAGLLGALVIGLVSKLIFGLTILGSVLIVITGFVGMLIDSFLGALLQAKYIDTNNTIGENLSDEVVLFKGYAWCNNNTVNLLSHIITISIFIVIAYMYNNV